MKLKQTNGRIAAALVTGALALGLTAGTPALAADGPSAQDAMENSSVEAATADHTAQDVAAHRYPRGKVVSRTGVVVRAKATTASRALGGVSSGMVVRIACKSHGQWVAGNNIWYKLADRSGWVTARYVKNLNPVKYCR